MEKHYICLGGCKGVSNTPGVCQASDCANHNHELVECSCVDGLHNDFKQSGKKLGLSKVYLLGGLLVLVYFLIFLSLGSPFGIFDFSLLGFGIFLILKSIISRRNSQKNSTKILGKVINGGLVVTGLASLLLFVLFAFSAYFIFYLLGVI